MDRARLSTLAGCGLAVALLLTGAVAAAPPQATAWTNGQWFDGQSFRRIDVYSVGPRLTLKRPKAVDRTVDLAGGYVTGAFGEAHNHNIPSGDTAATIRTYLAQGIYYVMIQANQPAARESLRPLVNTPTSVDAAFSNGLFTSPGGHPTALVERNIRNGGMTAEDRDGGFLVPVASNDDVDRQWWTRVRKQGPDFVKIVLVYSEDRVAGVPRPTDSDRHGLDPALAARIVKLAHKDGLRVSAHVESAYDFEVAVRARADVIAHMPGFWPVPERIAAQGIGLYRISEDAARRAGRQRVTVVTTFGESLRAITQPSSADARDNPELAALRQPLLDMYRHNLAVLTRHGVRIAIGSDQFRSTSIPEALALHEAGLMTPTALLRALTTDTAATVFPKRAPFGLAEGAPADFLVFDESPLADFTAIQRVRRRVKAGTELRAGL
jgi:hypothetical protein